MPLESINALSDFEVARSKDPSIPSARLAHARVSYLDYSMSVLAAACRHTCQR